jgi:uncharacterized YigZ family protein
MFIALKVFHRRALRCSNRFVLITQSLSQFVPSFTLRSDGLSEEVIKKSKFVGRISSVQSFEEAEIYLNKVMDCKATHNCWAYRSATTSRCSDDGEPAGTAGRPMLSALEGEGIVDAIVLVTRYYGGIKLGSGGLARAYGGAARGAILDAEKVVVVPTCTMSLQVELGHLGAVYQLFQQLQGKSEAFRKRSEAYVDSGTGTGTRVVFDLRIPVSDLSSFRTAIGDICKGREIIFVKEEAAS